MSDMSEEEVRHEALVATEIAQRVTRMATGDALLIHKEPCGCYTIVIIDSVQQAITSYERKPQS